MLAPKADIHWRPVHDAGISSTHSRLTNAKLVSKALAEMQPLRALIRDHRHFALALLVLAFCIKAAIPSGFMVSASPDTVLTVTVCSDASDGLKTMEIVIPAKERGSEHHDGAKNGEHCAFSGLAKVAVGGADAFLLALAVAFILVLGLAPVRRLPCRQFSHLRPPLRGPPAVA
ncbi:DUF2946 family protein [Citromicrobium bathyomarinum]|uniref:DUF2946 family protein n=1 Tax=Citromicrobium bathyomarinum TaxID=72174 RepID=UPI001E3C8D64|nr:DUF2946 family protein [Citromicrobium bathyomarinum]MCD1623608.1 hypothetical protein [Citromicrobium bathyomarinum]